MIIELRRHVVDIESIVVLCNYLIDSVCFWVIIVDPIVAVSTTKLELFDHVYIAQRIPTKWRRQQ